MWKRSSSCAERFPKTLFALSRCRIAEDEISETCSPDCRCTPTNATKQRTRRRSRQVEEWFASSVYIFPSAPARNYRKEPLGFLASKNQVGYEFQNSAREIRNRFEVAKQICKRKPRARKDWTGFLRTIHAHAAPTPFARARRGERAHARVLPSSSHPYLQEHGEHPTI
jgi:hypothetical protein